MTSQLHPLGVAHSFQQTSPADKPLAMRKTAVSPNTPQEQSLLKNLSMAAYGAKPDLFLNSLDTERNADINVLHKGRLDNGAEAFYQQVNHRPSSTIEFVLPLFPDSRDMHLSNNVLLNGTLEKKERLADLQAQGITLDTLVTQDYFTLYVNGPAGKEKDLAKTALEFLSQPNANEDEYASSKTIVMQNLLNLSNKPDFQKAEAIQRARVGDTHPYAKSTLKTIMEVKDLDAKETIREFKASYAHPEMTRVLMVSGMSPKEQQKLMNDVSMEAGWQTNESVAPPQSIVDIPDVKSQKVNGPILIADDRLNRVHMTSIWKTPKVGDDDYPAFIVMKNLMGGMTGSLFKTMRTERGLVYSTSSGVNANKRYGEFEVSAEIDVDKLDAAIVGLKDSVQVYVDEPPNDEELAKVKRTIIRTMREMESTSQGSIAVSSARLRDGLDPIDRESLQQRYMSVTPDDVQRVAKKYLGDDAWQVQAFTGPTAVLTAEFPNDKIQQREHYLTDNVDCPQGGHIYVKEGEGPMYPAELVMKSGPQDSGSLSSFLQQHKNGEPSAHKPARPSSDAEKGATPPYKPLHLSA